MKTEINSPLANSQGQICKLAVNHVQEVCIKWSIGTCKDSYV